MGGHDIPPLADKARKIPAADVVHDPAFVLPFSDDDMLSRKHTAKECLDLYRKAYSLKVGSPAIDTGSPEDAKDPEVKDGKCDIGAIEYEGPKAATATAPNGKP